MYMLCCPAETASDSAGVWGKEHCPWPGAGDSLQRGIHPSTGTGDCQPFSGGEEAGCEHTNLRCHSYCVLILFPPPPFHAGKRRILLHNGELYTSQENLIMLVHCFAGEPPSRVTYSCVRVGV